MVTLYCAVVGVAGSAFPVDIDENKSVGQLKDAIKEKNLDDPTLKNVAAKNLQLFLAKKKGGAWLPDDDVLDTMLPSEAASLYLKMRGSWKLNKPSLFGPGVSLGEDVVHVLVLVPKGAGDDVVLIEPSAPPTAMYRHPERLKRWAAINEMIRQKNQDGNEKTSNQDTNRKRKNRDLDSSVSYSSLSWAEVEPVLPMETYDLKAKPVPDEIVKQVLARLAQARMLYGDVYTGKEAKRKVFIVALLEAICLLLGDVKILVEEEVKGKNVHVHGQFEFVLKRGTKRISIVEAKRDNIEQGMAQNVAGLEALADVKGLERTLGIVTNYLNWVFISDDDETIQRVDQSLNASVPSFESLKVILGMICGMLAEQH